MGKIKMMIKSFTAIFLLALLMYGCGFTAGTGSKPPEGSFLDSLDQTINQSIYSVSGTISGHIPTLNMYVQAFRSDSSSNGNSVGIGTVLSAGQTSYSVTHLAPGKYTIMAWQDTAAVNVPGIPNTGDKVGFIADLIITNVNLTGQDIVLNGFF